MNTLGNLMPGIILIAMVGAALYAVIKNRRQTQGTELPDQTLQALTPTPTTAPSQRGSSGGAGAVFEGLCWVVTMLAATDGAFRLINLALSSSASAPQYAAEAAGVCAAVIVPYVFSRAVSGFRQA